MIHSEQRNSWLECDDDQLIRDCDFTPYKATGKGGQKKNKSSSAVRLVHRPTGIAVTESSERCQHTNRKRALKKLRIEFAYNIRSEQQISNIDINMSPNNKRYHFWIAMVIDSLESHNYAMADCAMTFDISTSRLVKLIARDNSLWQFVNEQRKVRSISPLKK